MALRVRQRRPAGEEAARVVLEVDADRIRNPVGVRGRDELLRLEAAALGEGLEAALEATEAPEADGLPHLAPDFGAVASQRWIALAAVAEGIAGVGKVETVAVDVLEDLVIARDVGDLGI